MGPKKFPVKIASITFLKNMVYKISYKDLKEETVKTTPENVK